MMSTCKRSTLGTEQVVVETKFLVVPTRLLQRGKAIRQYAAMRLTSVGITSKALTTTTVDEESMVSRFET